MTKNKKIAKKTDNFFIRTARFFADHRTQFAIGIILTGFVAYSLLAFVSHFFTAGIDQSHLIEWKPNEIKNWAGPLGAIYANFFINNCFGVASFALLFLLFVVALRLFKVRIIALWRAIVYSFLVLVWLSTASTFFFRSFYENTAVDWGGKHGLALTEWLEGYLKWSGTFIAIVVSFLLIAIFMDSRTILLLQKAGRAFLNLFKKKEKNKAIDEYRSEEKNKDERRNEEKEEDSWITPASNDDDEIVISLPPADDEDNNDVDFDVAETVPDETPEDIDKEYTEEKLGKYDPTLDLSRYKYPTINLLKEYDSRENLINEQEQNENKNRIITTLRHYGIEIDKIYATVGPTITLYEITPKPGVRIARIRNLESDIMLSLAATGIRIIAPIPGKGTIGIEVPNADPKTVSMFSIIASKKFQETKFSLPVALGRTITNEVFMFDLCKMPHLLVAGATGQGKSVGLNAIITSLLYKKHPAQLKFVLIDPKKVEFNIYADIERHFLAKLPDGEDAIITDVSKVVQTLNSLTKEMDERYDLLKKAHVRNVGEYNEKFIHRRLNPDKGHRYMPYIVVIIDEFGDLIMVAGKEVELPIARIAQLARAVGIHTIIATQRPSVNIITGVIKANFPARIAFRVSSQIDSRTILDASGANQLVGRGDLLFSQGSELVRVQCAFVDTPEVENIAQFIGNQQGYATAFYLPEYVGGDGEGSDLSNVDLSKKDPLFEEAARLLVASQQGSTSNIQRKFAIGYNRAGRIMDQLEAAGVVGPFEGSKARQVLIPDEYHLEQLFANMKF